MQEHLSKKAARRRSKLPFFLKTKTLNNFKTKKKMRRKNTSSPRKMKILMKKKARIIKTRVMNISKT